MIHLYFILFIAKLNDYIDKINYLVLYLGHAQYSSAYHVRRMGATQQNYYTQKGSLSHLPPYIVFGVVGPIALYKKV